MNKKGDVTQILFLLIILFITAILGILFWGLTDGVLQTQEDIGLFNDTVLAQQSIDKLQETAPRTTDYMVFFLFLGGIIGLMISAVRTNFSPTIMLLFVMYLIIAIFIASGLVNVYSGFAQSPVLSDSANDLIITNFIFSKYTPLIFAVLGTILMIIMWGKSGGDIVT